MWVYVVLGLALLLPGAHAASAVEAVILRPDDLGADWAAIENLIAEHQLIGGPDEPGLDNDPIYYRYDDWFIGRFDVNGDGVDELFILEDPIGGCGTAGCMAGVYQRLAGRWVEIAFVTGLDVHRCEFRFYYIVVADERHAGYRTLIGAEDGARWLYDETIGDGQYAYVCTTWRCAANSSRDWFDADLYLQ